MTARELARRVLERIERDKAWATPTLDGELARAHLEDRDRRLASELVYGVLRHRARLDRALGAHADLKKTPLRVVIALRVAAYQLMFLDRVPAYAVVDDAVAAARGSGGQKLAGFANAVLRKIGSQPEPHFPDGREGIEVEFSLPRWIANELAAAAPDELAEHAAAFATSAPLVARANSLRTTREAIREVLEATGVTTQDVDIPPGTPQAFAIDNLGDPARSASFTSGLWTVQDPGAQLVAHLAQPRAGMKILDACAGVGGKSTHLAELAEDNAVIDAADRSATKLDLAAATAQRMGITSLVRHVCDLTDPRAPLATDYDLIVLDAPCSGLGVLRRHPDAKWRLVADDVPRLAAVQRELLDAVAPRLAPGGALIYSVCTFTRAEGPEQARAFAERTGLRIVSEHRTWPPGADAFYLARFER
ncbi:MAG TPA: 16S rRNA (cytosine(967)-C(5))-methyltransferase RsmB [Kofleriaceae bacterium]